MSWQRRRVLVTGATGLVGSWLVKALLERGSEIVCLVRDFDPQSELIRSGDIARTTVVSGELEEYRVLERAIVENEAEVVFHLGAQTIVGSALRSPLATFESNVRGTYNLLEACRVHSGLVKAVVVASSDKAYGEASALPYDESMPPLGRHPYDVSKSCADLLATSYHHTYGMPVVIARCGNIYGGGDLNWSRIVPGTIRSLHFGEAPVLRSDGTSLRDYLFVKDAVSAYLAMADGLLSSPDKVAGHAFNFGPSAPRDVLTIVNLLRALMDREDLVPVLLGNAKAEIKHQYLDSSKAKRLLGVECSVSLEDGLRETVRWYQSMLRSVK